MKSSDVFEKSLEGLRENFVFVLTVLGVFGIFLGSIIIIVMLKTPSIRKNPANNSIFAILFVDLMFSAVLPILKKVRSDKF